MREVKFDDVLSCALEDGEARKGGGSFVIFGLPIVN